MALLMFVVYVVMWVLRGGSAIDAVRLCSMCLYVMPPSSLLCIPLGLCWSCLYVFSVSLGYALVSFLHFLSCCVNGGAIAFSGVT